MNRGIIIWGGASSGDIGLFITEPPVTRRPARKTEEVIIPGRNGNIVFAEDAWENVAIEYEVAFKGVQNNDYAKVAGAATEWLFFAQGYARLEDSFDPEIYREAYVVEGASFANHITRHGTATVTFNCKPQRFLKTGERAVTFTSSGGTLHNPTRFNARPLIYITGSGAGTLTIGSTVMGVLAMADYLYIDCDEMNVYRNAAENRNSYISADEFPVLAPGNNTVSFTGGVQSVTITPRWWTL